MTQLTNLTATARDVLAGWDSGPRGDMTHCAWHHAMAVDLAAALRGMLAAADPPPAEVTQAARRALEVSQALVLVDAVNPGIAAISREWLAGGLAIPSAEGLVQMLHQLPGTLNAARDVVVDAVRNRADRHAKDVFEPVTPPHMDRSTPDGVTVGDPVPSGLDPEAHWGGRCRLRPVGPTTWGWRECDRPAGHTGQHVALGPTTGDGTGPLSVVATWPADTGWKSL